jgi:hypothetical protein
MPNTREVEEAMCELGAAFVRLSNGDDHPGVLDAAATLNRVKLAV